MPGTFPRHRFQRKPLVSDPGMHHGTCVTHVLWSMSGTLTRCGRENVPGLPGTCATHIFSYLVRGPLTWIRGFIALPTESQGIQSVKFEWSYKHYISMWLKMSSAISNHWKARGVMMPKLSSLESTLPEAVPPVTTNLASWQLPVFSGCVYSDVNALVRNQYSTQVIHLIQIRFAIHHILEHPSIMSSIPHEEFRRKILTWFSVFLHQCAHVYNMWNFLSNCTSVKRH